MTLSPQVSVLELRCDIGKPKISLPQQHQQMKYQVG
jgi:hypothetical protein